MGHPGVTPITPVIMLLLHFASSTKLLITQYIHHFLPLVYSLEPETDNDGITTIQLQLPRLAAALYVRATASATSWRLSIAPQNSVTTQPAGARIP